MSRQEKNKVPLFTLLLLALVVGALSQSAPAMAGGGKYVFTSANKESLQDLINQVPSGSVIEIKLRELKLSEALIIPAGKEVTLVGSNTALSCTQSPIVIRVRGQLQARFLKIYGEVESYEAVLIVENCRLQSQKKGSGRAISAVCGGQTFISNCSILDYSKAFYVGGGATLNLKETYFWNNQWLGIVFGATLNMSKCQVKGDQNGLIATSSLLWIEDCLFDGIDMAIR